MQIERHAPDPRLRSAVATYQSRRADLAESGARIPLPARTEVLIEFYFQTPHLVELQRTGEREPAPWSVAVGPQTFRRVDLLLSGALDNFTIHFHPTGLHRLFRLPMDALANMAVEAQHLFGLRETRELHERLQAADSLAAQAAIMDQALLRRMPPPLRDAAAIAAARLQATQGAADLQALQAASGLSARQFRRSFAAQVGVSPKLYGRIVRLNAAIDAKRANPLAPWTEIAHRFGWFDQAHMDKDFKALAGDSPTGYFR